jgi:hypothetical protein
VRLLIKRQGRGERISLGDLLRVCPFQTLLARNDIMATLTPERRPDRVVAALGFKPEDFSERMRGDVLADLHAGRVVLLVSNRAELRDYAKRELGLAMTTPAGSG